MTNIGEIRASMHKAVDAMVAAYEAAGTGVQIDPAVKAQLEAQGIKLVLPKVNEAESRNFDDAYEALKLGVMAVRQPFAGQRNARPADEQKNFVNAMKDIAVENQVAAAREHMLKKLEGVDESQYKLFDYNPTTGKMRASAYSPVKKQWVAVGGDSGYNTPGSLAWKIKSIIKGGTVEKSTSDGSTDVVTAS